MNITLEQARGLLARAVLTQGPDFVYQPVLVPGVDSMVISGCFNIPVTTDIVPVDGLPEDHPKRKTGCLVGTAMKLAGVPHIPMRGDVNDAFGRVLEPDAVTYLRSAQAAQDSGKTWGESYATAERLWIVK